MDLICEALDSGGGVAAYAARVLSGPRVAFADMRPARNNCFLCRIRPGCG